MWQPLHAQIWHNVGNAGFSGGIANYTSLSIDTAGNPFIAYQDGGNGNKATLRHYDGANWLAVGTAGFSAGAAYYVSMALSGSGIPYIAYQDAGTDNKATVMKYENGAWLNVGQPGFSSGAAYYTSLALDASGTPYVAYQDFADSGKATVMKFNGANWVLVGVQGFSAGEAGYTNIAVNSHGQPYIVYEDFAHNHLITVMTYNDTQWVNVGTAGFSAGTASYTTIRIDRSDVPYVAFNQAGANVFKYNGSQWVQVGFPRFSGLEAFTSIAIADSGVVYVAGADLNNSSKAFVSSFDSSAFQTWRSVGSNASLATANYVSFALDKNNKPFIAYSDEQNGFRASVMEFSVFSGVDDAIDSIQQLQVYPNPSNGNVTIVPSEGGVLRVINVLGQIVRAVEAVSKQAIVLDSLEQGIYFVEVKGGVRKVIVQ